MDVAFRKENLGGCLVMVVVLGKEDVGGFGGRRRPLEQPAVGLTLSLARNPFVMSTRRW